VLGRLVGVFDARGIELAQHIGMAANRALAEDDHAASQDIRAFHRDGDRHQLIGAAEIIVRPQTNAFAAVNVHRIVDDRTHALGHVIFDDRRRHRGFFAQIDRAGRHGSRGIHHVGIAADARQGFFYAFEFADRRGKLLAYARIGAGCARAQFRRGDRLRRQRNRSPGGQAFHQHAPSLADTRLATDHPVHRNKNIFAGVRPVLEHAVERQMAAANIYARRFGGN
jgi:hypothetical protein